MELLLRQTPLNEIVDCMHLLPVLMVFVQSAKANKKIFPLLITQFANPFDSILPFTLTLDLKIIPLS